MILQERIIPKSYTKAVKAVFDGGSEYLHRYVGWPYIQATREQAEQALYGSTRAKLWISDRGDSAATVQVDSTECYTFKTTARVHGGKGR